MRKRRGKRSNWAAITVLLLFACAAGTIAFLYRNDLPIWPARQAYHYAPTASPDSSLSPELQNSPAATQTQATTQTPATIRTPAPTPTDLSPNVGEALDFSILPDGRLDINLANRKQLMDLPGIGEKISLRIIEYRDTHGPFLEYEDLMKVQGINRKLHESLKSYVGVSFEQ